MLLNPPFGIRIVGHAESFEIRGADGNANRYFYFEEEPTRRAFMGRMTKKQALQAAKTFARDAVEEAEKT